MPITPADAPPRRRRIALGRAALGLALALAAGCAEEPRFDEPRDIVLIVIDTLRADHLGAYGYPQPTSPNIDALARTGTVFTNATAPSSWTRPTMATLFTGRLPSEHGVRATADVLGDAIPTIATRLQDAGYRTLGVTANFVHITEVAGFDQGFRNFKSFSEKATDASDRLMDVWNVPVRAPTAPKINEQVLGSFDYLIAVNDLGDDPIFLYVHYMDPHSGYLAPAHYQRRFVGSATGPPATSDYLLDVATGKVAADAAERKRLEGLYDAEIAFVDDYVGKLLAGLESRGISDDAVIIVVSDHGEEFADHDGWFHGGTLHRELLHVPLILHDRRSRRGRVRDEPVDLLDLQATMLALGGLPPDPDAPGRNLLARRIPERPRVAELERDPVRESAGVPVRHLRAVAEGAWKAIVDTEGTVRLYDEEHDPAEQHPLAPEAADAPEGLIARARALAREALARAPDAAPELTPEQREALRALGYAE